MSVYVCWLYSTSSHQHIACLLFWTATSCQLLQVHHRWIPSSLKLYRDHPQWRSKWYPWKVDLTLKWSCRMIQQCLGKMANKNGCRWSCWVFCFDLAGFKRYFVCFNASIWRFFWFGLRQLFFLWCVCVCLRRMVLLFLFLPFVYICVCLKMMYPWQFFCDLDLFWIVFLWTLSKDVGDLQRSGLNHLVHVFLLGAEGVSAKKIPSDLLEKNNSSGCGCGSGSRKFPCIPEMLTQAGYYCRTKWWNMCSLQTV